MPGVAGRNAQEVSGSAIVQSESQLVSNTVMVPVGGPNGGTVPTVTVAVVAVPTAVGLGATDTRVTTGGTGATVIVCWLEYPLA